ncbi:hypothetical protein Zmor_012813 [Zophobas morio]|uniref:Carboxylesterase type B domain-containing protein n=1 Tax=Zophobas morio TaxID=2755281 RepID=A0AA38ME37_9CUCU|nr:hypothetical protein Zmor_012813 [Zophobas morio]
MGIKSRGVFWILIFLALILSTKCNSFMKNAKISTRIVQTRYGRLQGLVVPMDQHRYLKPIEIFLGVPYATPPVQSNRFSPTRTPSPWDGIRVSDQVGPVCPQKLPDITNETAALEKMPKGRLEYLKRLLPYLKNQSEDCLYLNIYAPAQGTHTANEMSKIHKVLRIPVYTANRDADIRSGAGGDAGPKEMYRCSPNSAC